MVVVVVLPERFLGMRIRRNSVNTEQAGYAPRFGPEIKYGRSSDKDGALRGSDAGQSRRK